MAYSTRQQQAVIRCLAQRRDEPLSAVELAGELRRAGHTVGLATVYRQLDKLEEAGLIHKLNTAGGALYQYCDHHETGEECFLLRCTGCGKVMHLDCSHLKPLYRHVEQSHHFRIAAHSAVFEGLCQDCALREEETHHGE